MNVCLEDLESLLDYILRESDEETTPAHWKAYCNINAAVAAERRKQDGESKGRAGDMAD